MKKYFISNNLTDTNSVDYFNIVLNFLLGLIFVIVIILTYSGYKELPYNYYTCIALLIILIILYKI